ncbi:hypothetical protein CL1_0275 [Thermococcus cleftensis]|uniref:Uncharacterized protein n=1 Tax=Thermococcus cleftensis (strain DSM 27260 / KACC 17922 / CL1) TaxID=163003 RepID=I3ZS03_THECF|nr:hypothetical protein [Thermococcus cleftensis]AFL94487.1 hypothetical protein CL1_0275 [Thermococcus cleftensis]
MEEIEVIFYIEGLGSDKKVLERAMRETAENLKGEKDVRVRRVLVEDVLENENEELLKYSSVIEAELAGDLASIVRLVLRYSPAMVEVLGPGKIEVESQELMKILGEVSLFLGKLMKQFGGLAVYPKLDDVPVPRIGYEREEIEELIVEDRNVLYRMVIEVFGESEEGIRETMAKALSLEGCRINKLVVQGETEDGKFKGLLAAELLSPFETLFQLTGKYAPVAISIIEPEIIDITANELQNALTDLGGFVNELVTRPVKRQIMERKNTEFKLNP